MSFNLLKSADIKKFSSLIGKPLTIQEKIDTCDFWIHISRNSVYVINKGKALSDIDYFLNSVYHEVEDLVYSYIAEDKREEFINEYGEFDVHIFYFPTDKPYHTFYPNNHNDELFIISDLWISDPKKLSGDKTNLLKKLADVFCVRTTILDTIICDNNFIELLKKYKADEINDLDFAKKIVNEQNTLNTFMDCTYGLLIKSDKNTWQIPIKIYERIPYNDMHTQYRDIVLHDFVSIVINNNIFVDSIKQVYEVNKNKHNSDIAYINTMAFAFLYYINKTDIFKKYYMEPDDLMPVHYGYTSDIAIDMVDDTTIHMICKHNELMKEVLRLLIHTFYNINHKTFNIFNELETRAISRFVYIFSR